MQAAAAAMQPAADKLKAMQWQEAMPMEQKALQALLRAEATFRQIQVAFGQRGGGGGGGGGGAGRDLASLFDLELDTEKNQYETAQTGFSGGAAGRRRWMTRWQKLDALAKRQEELAQQQRNQAQNFQQRWQQEMLRREAEQLQTQMEQMARTGSKGQQGQQGAAAGTTGTARTAGTASEQGQQGQQSGGSWSERAARWAVFSQSGAGGSRAAQATADGTGRGILV